MKTKTQLIALVALAAGGLLMMGAISLFFITGMGSYLQSSVDQGGRIEAAINDTRISQVALQRQVQAFKNILLRGNEAESYDKYLAEFGHEEQKVQTRLGALNTSLAAIGIDAAKITPLLAAHRELGAKYRSALTAFDKGNPAAGQVVDKQVKGIDRATASGMDELAAAIEKEAEAKLAALKTEAERSASRQKWIMVVVVVAGLAIVAVIGTVVGRNIFNQIGGEPAYAAEVTRRIADGDLTVAIEAHGGGDASLLAAMRSMQQNLRATVGEIASCAQSVSASARQMANAAAEVSVSTQTQAQATAGSAAAVEEFTVSIEHVADNARQASEQATETGKLANEGNQAIEHATGQIMAVGEGVEQTTGAIQALSREVEGIGNVAIVIKEVADQTNLLALNAAIEAARAGEQGRGFAVVADEVRKLAERTTNSVAEISSMIGTIQNETHRVVDSMQANRELTSNVVSVSASATGSMAQISYTTDSVVDAIAEVSSALGEQRAAATELARNIESIAQMSEENSAAVDAVAASAHDLDATSARLGQAVARFRI